MKLTKNKLFEALLPAKWHRLAYNKGRGLHGKVLQYKYSPTVYIALHGTVLQYKYSPRVYTYSPSRYSPISLPIFLCVSPFFFLYFHFLVVFFCLNSNLFLSITIFYSPFLFSLRFKLQLCYFNFIRWFCGFNFLNKTLKTCKKNTQFFKYIWQCVN